MALVTPVAFIIFNRPDTTDRVFQAIRQAQPKQLLVIADGPRADRPGEAEKCAATRAVIDRVDWECEVLTNYSDINLGCKHRVSSGIDWVFSQVEEAIILEDDCLPAPSFFPFCQTLLEKYRDDDRIAMISGTNCQQGNTRTSYSYYYSKYPHIWGWATWRRAWKNYDVDMKTWPACKQDNLLRAVFHDDYESDFWSGEFDGIHSGKVDTWDGQWAYTCFSQNQLSVIPGKNLISNIGFGINATHTTGTDSPWSNMLSHDVWEITHPPLLARAYEADLYNFDYHYGGKEIRGSNRFFKKIKNRMRPLKKLIFGLV
jgi:hypothetical protein